MRAPMKNVLDLFNKFWKAWHFVAIALILGLACGKACSIGAGCGLSPPMDIHIPTFEEFPPVDDSPKIMIEDEDGNETPAWIC